MARLKKIKIIPFALFQGLLGGHVGLLLGIIYSVGGFFYDLITTGGLNYGTALAFLALLGMPAIFAAVGFVLGIIEAILFNLLASWYGGIQLDFRGNSAKTS